MPYNEGGVNPPYDAAQQAYAETFQAAVLTALAPLPTAAQPKSGIYSAACFHHCVTQETDFWGIKVNNISFKDVAAEWFFDAVAPIHLVEHCTGFRCGKCRSHRKDPGAPPDPKSHPPRSKPPSWSMISPPPNAPLSRQEQQALATAENPALAHTTPPAHRTLLYSVLGLLLLGIGFVVYAFCLPCDPSPTRLVAPPRDEEKGRLVGGKGGGGYGASAKQDAKVVELQRVGTKEKEVPATTGSVAVAVPRPGPAAQAAATSKAAGGGGFKKPPAKK